MLCIQLQLPVLCFGWYDTSRNFVIIYLSAIRMRPPASLASSTGWRRRQRLPLADCTVGTVLKRYLHSVFCIKRGSSELWCERHSFYCPRLKLAPCSPNSKINLACTLLPCSVSPPVLRRLKLLYGPLLVFFRFYIYSRVVRSLTASLLTLAPLSIIFTVYASHHFHTTLYYINS